MVNRDADAPRAGHVWNPTSAVQAEIIARALMRSYGINHDVELTEALPYDIHAVASALERLGCVVLWNEAGTIAAIRRKAYIEEPATRARPACGY